MDQDSQQDDAAPPRLSKGVVGCGLVFALSVIFASLADSDQPPERSKGRSPAKAPAAAPEREGAEPQFFSVMELKDRPRMFHWFGDVPEALRKFAIDRDSPSSNIHSRDYAGAKSCQECHEKNYKRWSNHSHRFMNAYATEENVKGDFSDGARIEFMGGVGEFYREDGKFRMRLEREQVRVYHISRTIGSRFTQYYVGTLLDGPEPSDHVTRRVDHLLPFGYWMEPEEWVPVVNVGSGEGPDLERDDPFVVQDKYPYDRSCSECHTTKPTGDTMMSEGMMNRIDSYAPRTIHFALENYLRESHPEILEGIRDSSKLSKKQMVQTLSKGLDLPAVDHAVTLGIACEACHNGCADHVEDEEVMPSFFPKSPHIVVEGKSNEEVWGHNAINVNWACSRCHSGGRKTYAGGISTWNSTELSDAARGGCYDPVAAREKGMSHLTCVTCHNPHQGIGQQWPRTRTEDNKSCTDCHSQFKKEETLVAHTHHLATSTGSDCMNCHMPRINEGLQDMVRTHTIFSPTESKMIEANQPNACNQCHVDKGIDWTLGYLEDWYGAGGYDQNRIAINYPERAKPAALGWLKSSHSGTRLVGSDSLTRAKANWALPELIGMLDDDHLINRQFTARGLEKMLGRNLRDLGYRFYMFEDEREEPLRRIRGEFLEGVEE